VDYRYLKDQLSQETSEELRNAKHQAAANINRYSTVVSAHEMQSLAKKKAAQEA